MKADISGSITRATIGSPLTPLFLLTALAIGLIALLSIPREEEPQISVPMVDIILSAPGLKAPDVVEQVTKPLEEIIKAIPEVEHVYSQSQDDGALVTARFIVGTDADDAILRVHERIRANLDRIPPNVPMPMVIARGINDVPIVTLTLSPEPWTGDIWTDTSLRMLADELQTELLKVDDVGLTTLVGGRALEMRVEPDIQALASYGIPLRSLVESVQQAASAMPVGTARRDGQSLRVQAGSEVDSVGLLNKLELQGSDGRTVYLSDVALVRVVGADTESRVWSLNRRSDGSGFDPVPAVTLALAKRPGANAVKVAEAILARVDSLKGQLLPEGVRVEVTRNYGATADEKANELLYHLGLATVSIVVLIAFMIGWREALVTLIVIPTTILMTLFASLMMGYTINRVSLFALIFSIGILVDDAIVVIENIARHWAMKDERTRTQAAIDAVSEVGNPTIVATLTVITALLPMMFVSGLMGPYMAPIPAVASAAMAFSFFVAVGIAPWLVMRIASGAKVPEGAHHGGETRVSRFYRRVAEPIVASRMRAWSFLLIIGFATLGSLLLFATRTVPVKLLPFDNKSEIQIVVDLPEGAPVEDTERILFALADAMREVEEVETIQAYAGTAAPFNFNGLVRHYFLRASPELGDLQVNLADKSHRKRNSHEIALDLRARLIALPVPEGSSVKVVEVPPGPPVMSTLMAEIYGPSPDIRRKTASVVRNLFEDTDFIVDVDDSIGTPAPRLMISVDEPRAADYGVAQGDILDTISLAFEGQTVGVAPRGEGRDPLDIRVRLSKSSRNWSQEIASIPVPTQTGVTDETPVELGALVEVSEQMGSELVYRRDGYFADLVTGELAGKFEAPIYGMFEIQARIDKFDWAAAGLEKPLVRMYGQPKDESRPALLWDGEWEVTYVTFRDMGLAFGVALFGIYVLVVAQFKTFRVPLIILTPVPLTLIGIMLGHWLFGAPFTATSMIGFIALAGIIVRNSILLVDFVRHRQDGVTRLKDVLLDAGAIRFKPILLTALAAMIGASVILTDPIFQGLAISLLFGLASSTALTVLVIPAIYIAIRGPDWLPRASTDYANPNAPETPGL
ncbi:efflux RND transporter permease subunit [Hyphomonas chukchiensis]|uniref:Multidrug transporter AcrB n=1 Tax=Hyphomonas chukchiensis TaxID=1280947 RepID=A0A062UFL6_9PROT|nr:efflux RND transporter permease subunit [Hyphomonas chukchiensis]KCZ57107.1 multidrug transporter AcrB [Hyphomonas chukchiensis]